MTTLAPTKQAIGPYELVQKIAEGGMGSVYKLRKRGSDDFVAMKILPPHLAKNQVLLKRFEQEYNAARVIDHPNIVRSLDFGREGDSYYLVMEFVEGESLGQRLDRGAMPEHDAIRIIAQVAQGLRKAHKQGMVHRDVKPDNILITNDGVAKLTDLGLVKEMETDLNLTRTGRGLGTPHFMAPEQFRNAKKADARCDIYSMAATLYMMVTGELPFKSCSPLDAWMKKIQNEITPPRQLTPGLSERVDWAIRRGMSADPMQRPGTTREFVEDLTGHSTRRIAPTPGGDTADTWYLVYRDDEGVAHSVKGSTECVRRSLREGLLGDASNVRVGRVKTGPFEPLRQHPEFRDLVIEPMAMSGPKVPTPLPLAPLPPIKATPSVTPRPPTRDSSSSSDVSSSQFIVPLAPPRPANESGSAPHIPLGASIGAEEWVKWLTVLAFALSAGVGGFFVVRWLTAMRLI